jgi:hypothetical protein
MYKSWVTACCLLLATGCLIEERKFDAAYAQELEEAENPQDTAEQDASSEGPAADCVAYCDRVMSNCQDEYLVYASHDACLAVCALLPKEGVDEEDRNTLACRMEQAQLARTTGEPQVHCPAAGPGGSSRLQRNDCATNCESYCMLQPLVCSQTDELILEPDECKRQCAALADDGSFDAVVHHDANNIQCRLVHLSSGALNEAAALSHCWHSSIAPQLDSPCGFPANVDPTCEEYCRVVNLACAGDQAVYDSVESCEATCTGFALGTGKDRVENTLGCRTYHAYASLNAPDTHCAHASPAGDGHCGTDNCEAYCGLAEAKCGERFASEFGSSAACLAACSEWPGAAPESGYTVATAAEGDSVACRIYYASHALEDPEQCAAVFGEDPCD